MTTKHGNESIVVKAVDALDICSNVKKIYYMMIFNDVKLLKLKDKIKKQNK